MSRDPIRPPVREPERFLTFGAPLIEEAEIQEVVACLRSGWLGTGPRVTRFEQDFAAYKGVRSGTAVASCTAALHLSMLAAGVKPGDEVVTTAMTFCATVNAIIHAGAHPKVVDVDPHTMNMDARLLEAAISERTKAVIPVHFAGRACDMDPILQVAERADLKVIEDCAHAIETEYKGRAAGTFGDFGCFSFYVTKNVAAGEGGMVTTRSEADAARIRILALHGMDKDAWKRYSDEGFRHYELVECGFKYNMTDLQAAIGIHQLARIERNWRRREEIWQRYDAAFAGLPVGRPPKPEPDTRHAYHLYTLMIDPMDAGIGRDDFVVAMTKENIGVGVHYLSLVDQPYYQNRYGWLPENCPAASEIGKSTVSLPLSAALTVEDVEDVITAVKRVLA